MPTALVTGANGFVGSHLVRELEGAGWQVRAMVRARSNTSLLADCEAERVQADLLDASSLPAAVQGAEVVFHAAAALGQPSQEAFDRVNIGGTRALVQALSAASSCRRLVLISSAAAAGPSTADQPRTEAMPPAPISRYGRSKRAAEVELAALGEQLATTIVRPPAVYGPGCWSMVPLARAAARGWLPVLAGGPRPISAIDVRELAQGLRELAIREEAADELFYLTGPEDTSVEGLQRGFAHAMGVPARRLPLPVSLLRGAGHVVDAWKRLSGRSHPFGADKIVEGQACWRVCDDKARQLTSPEDRIPLSRGLAETVEDYRRRGWLKTAGGSADEIPRPDY